MSYLLPKCIIKPRLALNVYPFSCFPSYGYTSWDELIETIRVIFLLQAPLLHAEHRSRGQYCYILSCCSTIPNLRDLGVTFWS